MKVLQNNNIGIKIALVLALFLGSSWGAALQCLNRNNQPVDWFFLYKMSSIVGGDYKGYTYVYLDSTDSSWTEGNFQISTSNPVTNTILQMFPNGNYSARRAHVNNPGDIVTDRAWVMYNDQTYDTPEDLSSGKCINHEEDDSGVYYGHTKGDLCFDKSTGFYLTHSAPGFPLAHYLAPSSWYFPASQTVYGQAFFCISISSSTADQIAGLLQYTHAHVYDFNLPSSWDSSFPNFNTLIQNKYSTDHGHISFSSLAGKQFEGFAKHGLTDSDLYEDYVEPYLKTGLKVESWCGGIYDFDCEPSYCQGKPIVNASRPQSQSSTYTSNDVNVSELRFSSSLGFLNKYDHAKWAIAYNPHSTPEEPWFCMGDINRELAQRRRGGGAVCMQDSEVWGAMNKAITKYDNDCEAKE